MNKLYVYLLISALSLGAFGSAEARRYVAHRTSQFSTLRPVLGSSDNLKVKVRQYSVLTSSGKKPTLKLAVNALNFATKASYPQSFKIKSYYYDPDGSEHFLNLSSLTVLNKRHRVKIITLPIEGLSDSQDLYFDLYDSANRKIAVFKHYLQMPASFALASTTALDAANCDSYQFGDCQLKYIFDNVKFETKPTTKLETSISKELNGTYTVSLPIANPKPNSADKKEMVTIEVPEPALDSDTVLDVNVDWTKGSRQKLTLNQDLNLKFNDPSAVGQFTLMLYQDDIGRHSVSWPSDVKWSEGAAPDLSLGANKLDIVNCFYDLTNYYCGYGLNFI